MMTGLILAGGPSRRLDGNWKALLPFGGEALIQRQVREMRTVCKEIIVATQDPRPFLRVVDTDVRIITDYYPGKGPLGGMHAGFSLSKSPNIWVADSGMPFLSARAAEMLLQRKQDGFEAAVPQMNGDIYPLHGVYDKSCAAEVLSLLNKGESRLSELLKELFWFGVPYATFVENGVDSRFIVSLDTWEDYRKALPAVQDPSAS